MQVPTAAVKECRGECVRGAVVVIPLQCWCQLSRVPAALWGEVLTFRNPDPETDTP